MNWINANLAGTRQVFTFTAAQFLKNRANLVTFVLLFVFCLVSVPLLSLLGSGSAQQALPAQSGLTQVYVQDDTSLDLPWAELAQEDAYYSQTSFLPASQLSGSLGETQVLVRLTQGETGTYQLELSTGTNSPEESQLSRLESFFTQNIQQAGLTQEQAILLQGGVTVQSQSAEEYFAPDQEANWETGYWTQMIYSILVLMVSIFSVSYIVRAVVEEKSSKLVETLLVSIRPLALILGKILAVMVCVFGGFAALALGVLLSFAGTSLLWPQLSIAGISGFFSGISLGWDTVPVLVVSLALGYLTFALVAGLSGAGCSSTQELDGAMSFSVLLIMAGYLAGIFISTLSGGAGFWPVFASLCPILSVFCAPVQYVMGVIPFWLLGVSWLIQIGVVVLLALLCARVYQALLLYRGDRLSFGKILSLAAGEGGAR